MLKVLKYSLNAISLKKKNFYSQKLPILSLNCTKFLSSQLLWGLFHLFYLTVIFTNLSVPYLNLRLQVLTMTLDTTVAWTRAVAMQMEKSGQTQYIF